jgi:predicted RNase H-like HicB family nuclease
MGYPVIIERDEDGCYIVSCPLFKACHSYGKTEEEALDRLKEVIKMCCLEELEDNDCNEFLNCKVVELTP